MLSKVDQVHFLSGTEKEETILPGALVPAAGEIQGLDLVLGVEVANMVTETVIEGEDQDLSQILDLIPQSIEGLIEAIMKEEEREVAVGMREEGAKVRIGTGEVAVEMIRSQEKVRMWEFEVVSNGIYCRWISGDSEEYAMECDMAAVERRI